MQVGSEAAATLRLGLTMVFCSEDLVGAAGGDPADFPNLEEGRDGEVLLSPVPWCLHLDCSLLIQHLL